MSNAINWFEVPVADLNRAKRFYGEVLGAELREERMDGMNMAIFPYSDDKVGGALIAGEQYTPGAQGPVIYLNAGEDLAKPLARVEKAGGKVVMPKTFLSDDIGYIAMFIDSEGNRLALHSPH